MPLCTNLPPPNLTPPPQSPPLTELGIYPAVDPLDSTSRMLNPRILGDEHYGGAWAALMLVLVLPCGSCLRACSVAVPAWQRP